MMGFLIGFLASMLVTGVVWMIVAKRRRQFLGHVSKVVTEVTAGNLHSRVQTIGLKREQGFANDVNDMLGALAEQIAGMSQERNVLSHILDGMTTGVVYVASSGDIQMMNPTAKRIFRCSDEYFGKSHSEVFRHSNLNAAINRALLFGTSWRQELKIDDDLVIDFRIVCVEGDSTSRQMAYFVLVLCSDVTQWHRLEQMRSDFIANVSHELKTPITAIQGFAETLSSEVADEETRSAFLRVIYDEAVRMRRLVDDLLTLSKLETQNNMALNFQSVDLFPVAKRALDRLQEEARKRDLHLDVESSTDIAVWGDEGKLLQVFLNLVMNAIHYTPSGGRISVSWDVLLDHVKIHVKDTGIGILEEHQKRVFERFYRVDRDRSRSSGGTGLGLAIVKHIVNAHSGQVGVTSHPGDGSDFWFTVPRYAGIPTDTNPIV